MTGNGIRKEKIELLLDALRRLGKLRLAAAECGIAYQTVIQKRYEQPDFRELTDDAIEAHKDYIEDEIRRRGVEGETYPVTYKDTVVSVWIDKKTGEIIPDRIVEEIPRSERICRILMETEKSDTCLLAYAKALMPEKYRDSSSNINSRVGADELLEADPALVRAQLPPGSIPE